MAVSFWFTPIATPLCCFPLFFFIFLHPKSNISLPSAINLCEPRQTNQEAHLEYPKADPGTEDVDGNRKNGWRKMGKNPGIPDWRYLLGKRSIIREQGFRPPGVYSLVFRNSDYPGGAYTGSTNTYSRRIYPQRDPPPSPISDSVDLTN